MRINQLITCLALVTTSAWSQTVTVTDPWVRATVPGQKATGAFMKLSSTQAMRLVSAQSNVAGVVEIHEMKMTDNVMRMSALPQGLPLPAGQMVELRPGGYHIMLMDLKSDLPAQSEVVLKLMFQDAQGKTTGQELKVPVRGQNQPAPPSHSHKH
jgi:copper(I)-binding protein